MNEGPAREDHPRLGYANLGCVSEERASMGSCEADIPKIVADLQLLENLCISRCELWTYLVITDLGSYYLPRSKAISSSGINLLVLLNIYF